LRRAKTFCEGSGSALTGAPLPCARACRCVRSWAAARHDARIRSELIVAPGGSDF